MKVTLKRFLEIVGENFFLSGTCKVKVETLDPEWGDTKFEEQGFTGKDGRVRNVIASLDSLTPFLDWEIVQFSQELAWDEVQDQIIYLREIKE